MEKYKTLIFLDYDDTLLPTSWIIKNNINTDNERQNKYISYFFKLDYLLSQLLSTLSKYGQVVICTNASAKWVMTSSSLVPTSQKILRQKTIIISARDAYGNMYPDNMAMWKKKTFEDVTHWFYRNYKFQNIISAGDAEYEFTALTDLYDEESKYRILKTIRFTKDPSLDDLADELAVFNNCAEKILLNVSHLDLEFKDKKFV